MIKVNESAPVLARGEIKISTDPETVWNVLTDIEEWPRWNLDVKNAFLDGEVSVGSKFKWKAGPGTITSTFQQVDRHKLLAWTGKTLGIKAIHVWKLESEEDKTVVRTEESWEGLIVGIMHGRMQKILNESIESGLQYLKVETERISIQNP